MTLRRPFGLLAYLAVFAATPCPLAAQGSSGGAQYASLQRAMDRGKTMYLYDRAAWVTSDDLVARVPADRQPEIGGWVVTQTISGLHVDYFGKDKSADHVIYAADVNGGTVSNAVVFPASTEPALKEPALLMARALHAAWAEMERHSDWQPCTNARFNTIVLPPTISLAIFAIVLVVPALIRGDFRRPFGAGE